MYIISWQYFSWTNFFDLTRYQILALMVDIIHLTIGRIKIQRYELKCVLDHSIDATGVDYRLLKYVKYLSKP